MKTGFPSSAKTLFLFGFISLTLTSCVFKEGRDNEISGSALPDISKEVQDSVYIKFDTTGAPKIRGGITLFDSHDYQRIAVELSDFKAYPFDKGSAFMLFTVPNEAIYPVRPNDSVIVGYNEDYYPVIRILNNEEFTPEELNFTVFLARQRKSIFEYFLRKLEGDSNYGSIEETYIAATNLVDSCEKSGMIGEKYLEWLRPQMAYAYYSLLLKDNGPSLLNEQKISKRLNQSHLFQYRYYRRFLQDYARWFESREAEKESDMIFNHIGRIFKGREKDFVLYRTAYVHLNQNADIENRKAVLSKIENQFDDKAYLNLLYQHFPITEQYKSFGKDGLVNTENTEFNTSSVFESLKGKVVYVDFWASWCVPCRIEMPTSIALRKQFSNREIVFLYLSLDDNHARWIQANREESLGSHYSYRLTDPRNANLVKEFKIDKIPRYMLLGKDSKVIDSDAFKPSDEKLKALIESHL